MTPDQQTESDGTGDRIAMKPEPDGDGTVMKPVTKWRQNQNQNQMVTEPEPELDGDRIATKLDRDVDRTELARVADRAGWDQTGWMWIGWTGRIDLSQRTMS